MGAGQNSEKALSVTENRRVGGSIRPWHHLSNSTDFEIECHAVLAETDGGSRCNSIAPRRSHLRRDLHRSLPN